MTISTVPHIGKIIHHARVFNFQHSQGVLGTMDELLQSVENLFELLHQRSIHYVLVGGIALLQYIQGRNTEDINLIFHVSELQKLPEITITHQNNYFARGMYDTLQIDFLLTENPVFAHVQQKYTIMQPFRERTIVSATVTGLILLKLYALPSLYRQGDFARVGLYENDLATLMFYHQPDMQAIIAELAPFVSTHDLAALQDVIRDLSARIARFQRNQE